MLHGAEVRVYLQQNKKKAKEGKKCDAKTMMSLINQFFFSVSEEIDHGLKSNNGGLRYVKNNRRRRSEDRKKRSLKGALLCAVGATLAA